MENNFVDNTTDIGYNVAKDDLNEFVTEMALVPPLNDTACTHETLVADPEDKIGDAVYHGCANFKCGRGWYIHPNANKNIT